MPSALLLLGSPPPVLFSIKRPLASPGFTWHQLHLLSINRVVSCSVWTIPRFQRSFPAFPKTTLADLGLAAYNTLALE
jgi:hypothetical protein